MAKFWFRPKQYGYGATPVTWQGWLVTFAAPLAILATILLFGAAGAQASVANALIVVAVAITATVATIVISRRKTDGEWRWRWGSNDALNK